MNSVRTCRNPNAMKLLIGLPSLWWFVLALLLIPVSSSSLSSSAKVGYEERNDSNGPNQESRQLQSSNVRVVAEAYECDEFLNPMPPEIRDQPKPFEYEIRVCLRPVTPTRNRGIVMRSIDDFTFYQNFGDIVQLAVQNGFDQPRTLQVCIPGRVVCSFKTKLRPDFWFGARNGTIVGTGTVSMQVEGNEDNPEIRRRGLLGKKNSNSNSDEAGIVQAVIQWAGVGSRAGRSLQRAADGMGGFAGQSGVKLEINVVDLERPDDFQPSEEEDITSWWKDSPTWLKVLVIGGGVLLLLMLCCLICMCLWSLRECAKEQSEPNKLEEEYEEQEQAPRTTVHISAPIDPAAAAAWENSKASSSSSEENADDNEDDDQGETASQAPKNTQPGKKDICFGLDEHKGNKALDKAIKKTLRRFPYIEDFSPDQYKDIKDQLPGRRFFIREDTDEPDAWKEASPLELVDLVRDEYMTAKADQETKR